MRFCELTQRKPAKNEMMIESNCMRIFLLLQEKLFSVDSFARAHLSENLSARFDKLSLWLDNKGALDELDGDDAV